jgi:flagellar hook-length control protein FliK
MPPGQGMHNLQGDAHLVEPGRADTAGGEAASQASAAGGQQSDETIELVIKAEVAPLEQSAGKHRVQLGNEMLNDTVRPDVSLQHGAQTASRQVSAEQGETTAHPGAELREQIVAQVREKLADLRLTTDSNQVTLRLHPAELGELRISIRLDDQRLRVEIMADNRQVRDALLENADNLRDALSRQNLSMERFHVFSGGRQFPEQGFREAWQQPQQQTSTRMPSWLSGQSAEAEEGQQTASWQPRESALLDMMM